MPKQMNYPKNISKNISKNIAKMAYTLCTYLIQEYCRNCNTLVLCQFDSPQTICSTCWTKISNIEPTIEKLISKEGDSFNLAYCLPYTGIIKKLIKQLKYDKDILIAHDLGLLLKNCFKYFLSYLNNSNIITKHNIILLSVPLHWYKQWQREFNQASMLAKIISKEEKIFLSEKFLSRKKYTKPQHNLTKEMRHNNLDSAFACSKYVRNKDIILVDDICTTGSTLLACRNILIANGAKSVSAIVVARAIENN